MIAKLQQMPGGDHARALKAADKAVELTKDDVQSAGGGAGDPWQFADRSRKAGSRFRRADQADAVGPRSPLEPRHCFSATKRNTKAALADIDSLLKIDSQAKRPGLHIARGVVLFELKRNDEAMHSFDRAIQLEPGSADPYVERARIRAAMKDTKGAIEDLDTALHARARKSWALLTRARVYQQAGDLQKAKEDIDTALKSQPGDALALRLQVAIFAERKEIRRGDQRPREIGQDRAGQSRS